MLQRMSRSYL